MAGEGDATQTLTFQLQCDYRVRLSLCVDL